MGTKVYGSQVFWGGSGILEMTLTDGAYTYSFVLPPARLRTAVAEPATRATPCARNPVYGAPSYLQAKENM